MPTDQPGATSLSVVVAAWNDADRLRECLDSLAAESKTIPLEVLVATADRHEIADLLAADFPWATAVVVAGKPSVPELRRAGLERARGDVVVFLEDHATVDAGWAAALRSAYVTDGVSGVGGPVAQGANRSTLEWGAYLVDYGRFMPPRAAGAVRDFSGLNMSFARPLLDTLGELLRDGVFEGPLFEELGRRKVGLVMAPGAIVHQHRRFTWREALQSPYYLARGYAGRRLGPKRPVARIVRAASCIVLPAVMVARVMAEVLPKRKDTARVVRAAGVVVLISAAWSLGEFVGYLAGAGDSDSRWR